MARFRPPIQPTLVNREVSHELYILYRVTISCQAQTSQDLQGVGFDCDTGVVKDDTHSYIYSLWTLIEIGRMAHCGPVESRSLALWNQLIWKWSAGGIEKKNMSRNRGTKFMTMDRCLFRWWFFFDLILWFRTKKI